MDLTSGEPAERRRFIDRIIAQRDSRYFDALVRYNGALEQRNRLLRDEVTDEGIYEALEAQLEVAGEYIKIIFSNPTFIIFPTFIINKMIIVGMIPGSVI